MTKVNIDLWVMLAGVALPSACLLLISLTYCWRRLSRRRQAKAISDQQSPGFDQQLLMQMVLQQTDTALNNIVDAVQQQRLELLKVLETHKLPSHMASACPTPATRLTTESVELTDLADVEAAPNPTSELSGSMIRTKETAAIFDPYSQIPDLIKQGLSEREVATRLNLPQSAIELYVKLRLSAPNGDRQRTA